MFVFLEAQKSCVLLNWVSGSHKSRLLLPAWPVPSTCYPRPLFSLRSGSTHQGLPPGGHLLAQPPADGSLTLPGGSPQQPVPWALRGPARPAPRRLDGHVRCRGCVPSPGSPDLGATLPASCCGARGTRAVQVRLRGGSDQRPWRRWGSAWCRGLGRTGHLALSTHSPSQGVLLAFLCWRREQSA